VYVIKNTQEDKKGLELNATHSSLSVLMILSAKTYVKKEKIFLLNATIKVGQKKQSIRMSRHQTTENTSAANKYLKTLADLKFLGMTEET
jgi:hypothetical protein